MKHRKRLLSLLLCVCLLLSATTGLSYSAFAEEPSPSDFSFFYDVIDGEKKFIVVFGMEGPVTGGVLEIPPKINGYTVKEIGWNAFRDRPGLRELILPDTVAYIGGSAFENCQNLKTVKLSNGLEVIDNGAFAGCASLEAIELPETLFRLEDRTFEGCASLKTAKLPAGLEIIQNSVFAWCEALEEIELPERLREIRYGAFEGCAALKSVAIPGAVEYIPEYAFAECGALESVTLSEGLRDIGSFAFVGCASLKDLTLPESLRGIGEQSFVDCASLEELAIPAGVDHIHPDAFPGCTSLATVTAAPDNRSYTAVDNVLYNKNMNAMIFYPAGKPDTAFTMPDATRSIDGRFAFDSAPLTELNLNHVDNIAPGAVAMSNIKKLTKAPDNRGIVIIDNVLYNDSGEFLLDYPGGLTATSFTVPEKVWNIEDSAFRGNQYLKKVVLPEGVTQIMNRAFKNAVVEEVNIPSTVRILDEAVFIDCANLKSAAIPDGVTAIPYAMFAGCVSLKQVTLPGSVTEIGDFAFAECETMEMPTLPERLETIGFGAFNNCLLLKKLDLPAGVRFIGKDAFADTPWFDALPDGPVYLNNVLYIYKGEVPENTDFTVKDGTVMITEQAFAWQWGLTKLTVPDSVTTVGGEAFAGTRWFNEILPEGDVYIGKVFYGHKGEYTEKALKLKDGTVSVTPGAFRNMDRVETLELPASLAEVRDWELFDLRSLKEYRVAKGNETFSAENGVLYAEGGTALLSYPAQKADKAYQIPYGVERIAWRAFFNNEHLETLTVPAGLRNAEGAMENCPALKDVYYGGVRRTWDETPGSYSLLQRDTQLHVTHEDMFRDGGKTITVVPGCRVGDVIFTLNEGEGLPVNRPDGSPAEHFEDVRSGMTLTRKDGKKAALVLLGDTDGDGELTSADARNALRYSVRLDDPAQWQLAAAKVSGEENVTSADARLILRASVRLEDPNGWFCAA